MKGSIMSKGQLHIGWSNVDITPPRKTLLMGQFHQRLADSAISPLTATAMALETTGDGGDQAVLLSCDLAQESFKPDLLTALDGRCPGFDLTKLTINATHTHTAPAVHSGMYEEPENDPDFMTPDQYRAFLVERLAQAVETAWTERRPGSISRGFGYAVIGRCRRAVYADGSAKMYGLTSNENFIGLEACDDHAINFLFTRTESGELDGILVNVACPSQCDEAKSEFSADFWHDVRELLAERHGPNVHLLPQCAPAGDASPHLMLDRKEEAFLRSRMGVDDKGVIARRILNAVDEALTFASPPKSEVEFNHVVRRLSLPRLKVTKEEYELEKRIPSMSEEERERQPRGFQRLWPFGPICELISRYESQGDNPVHEMESHVIRLGDVVFATNPFELFMDYGARIRARSKAAQTFLVQLADGSGDGFYLPTQRALEGAHYSAVIKSNWVGPEGGQTLIDETVSAINDLFTDEDYPTTR